MTDAPVPVSLDASAVRREAAAVAGLARGMGSAFTEAFRAAIVEGQSFGGVLRDLALRVSELSLTAALKPVEGFLGNVLTTGFTAVRPAATAATTSIVTGAGQIAAPSYLPRTSASPAAVPANASATPAGTQAAAASPAIRGATHVTVNIATPDAESFRRSESQVSAALARAVARGHRSL